MNDIEKPVMMRKHIDVPSRSELRPVERKSVAEVVIELCGGLTSNEHIVVGDNWFGNVSTTTELKLIGIDSVIVKCMSNRPTGLWRSVHAMTHDDNDVVLAKCKNDLNQNMFIVSKRTDDKHHNLLSKVEMHGFVCKTIKTSIDNERCNQESVIHKMFDYYNQVSSVVDENSAPQPVGMFGMTILSKVASLAISSPLFNLLKLMKGERTLTF